jgi:hypothetical protein
MPGHQELFGTFSLKKKKKKRKEKKEKQNSKWKQSNFSFLPLHWALIIFGREGSV